MKLFYTNSITYPSIRANRLQVKEMAGQFYRILGANFLFGLRSEYDDNKSIPVYVATSKKSPFLAIEFLRIATKKKVTHIYCREERLLFFMIFFARFLSYKGIFVYEIHRLHPWRWFLKFLLKKCQKIISITNGLKNQISFYAKVEIMVSPDAVNVDEFDISNQDKVDSRVKLKLKKDAKIILYTGHLYDWKGVDLIPQIAKILDDFTFLMVGGTELAISNFRRDYLNGISNVTLVPHVQHEKVPLYLAAADVLLLPNSGKFEISRLHTSPLKLFEYMMSKKPIVASRLPSIEEAVSDEDVFFAEPDNAKSFADKITEAVSNLSLSEQKVLSAYERVRDNTWSKRAEQIISYIKE